MKEKQPSNEILSFTGPTVGSWLNLKDNPDVAFLEIKLEQRVLYWEPKEDITAYELALIIPMFSFAASSQLATAAIFAAYDQLKPEAQRHWRVFDPSA